MDIKVSVNIDETVEKLYEIGSLVDELSDLVPDWSQMEAEKIQSEIFNQLKMLIHAK